MTPSNNEDLAARIAVEGHGTYEPDFECEVPGGAIEGVAE